MKAPKDIEKYWKHYDEDKLLTKMKKVARKAGIKVIYLVLVLYYVLASDNVSSSDKGKIWGALGYFILPVDLIPDFIPVAGYSDDLAALLWAFYAIGKNITPEIKSAAEKKLREWFGDYDREEITLS